MAELVNGLTGTGDSPDPQCRIGEPLYSEDEVVERWLVRCPPFGHHVQPSNEQHDGAFGIQILAYRTVRESFFNESAPDRLIGILFDHQLGPVFLRKTYEISDGYEGEGTITKDGFQVHADCDEQFQSPGGSRG